MKFLSSVDMYNDIVNSIYKEHIQPLLIESFVEFYGEQARMQIENLFGDLIILRREYVNLLKPNAKEYIDYFRKIRNDTFFRISRTLSKEQKVSPYDFSSQEIHHIVSMYPSLIMDDFITLKKATLEATYYQGVSFLIKHNPNQFSVFVGTNLSCTLDAKELSDKIVKFTNLENDGEWTRGYMIPGLDHFPIVQLFGQGIPLHTLIHEVNHLLNKKTLLQFEDRPNIVSSGISPIFPDLIYEIINDYMTDEIQKIFSNKMIESEQELYSYILSDCASNMRFYTLIDYTCNGKIQNFYQSAHDLIKECIIQGEGKKIYKIIGSDVYEKINKRFLHVANCIKENPNLRFSLDYNLSAEFDSYETILNNRLDEYYQYEKTIGSYRTFPLNQ